MIELKIARIKFGLTQESLSKKSGVGRTTISQLENGKIDYLNLSFKILKHLAEALDTTVQDLFLSDEE